MRDARIMKNPDKKPCNVNSNDDEPDDGNDLHFIMDGDKCDEKLQGTALPPPKPTFFNLPQIVEHFEIGKNKIYSIRVTSPIKFLRLRI